MKSDLLQQFQAPALRTWLTMNPEFLLAPVHQDAAIVFVDLSGFTSLSETHGMDAVLEVLKEFHTLVDRDVVAHGEIVTSFLGDGAMILFGLPGGGSWTTPRRTRRFAASRSATASNNRTRSAAAIDRVANRLQGGRPFRPHHRIPARRRQLSAHHRDG